MAEPQDMDGGDGERTPEPDRFDLEERTAQFGESVIAFCRKVPVDPVTTPLIRQLVRASTSVGANYGEANDAGSKKEFRQFINVCQRESKESKHWLRMIVAAVPDLRDDAAVNWREAKELNLIFGRIRRSCDGKG